MTESKPEPIHVRTYRGVAVMLTQSSVPIFFARHAGQVYRGGSYETLTKKLDAALSFDTFEALRIVRTPHGHNQPGMMVEKVQVVGVSRTTNNSLRYEIVDSEGVQRTIDGWSELFPVALRDELETYLGNCEQWDREAATIKEAQSNERQRITKLAFPRADSDD